MKKNTKKILVVTERWYPDTFGGSERLAFEQVQGLADAGFSVDVFVATNMRALPLTEHTDQHITIHRAPGALAIPGNQLYSINVQSRKPLAALLTAERYDAILCHHPQIGDAVLTYRVGTKNFHTPLLYFFHSSQPQEIRVDGPNRSYPGKAIWNEIVAQYVEAKEHRILRAADHIMVFSAFSSNILHTLNNAAWEHSEIISPGINTDLYDTVFERRQTHTGSFTPDTTAKTRFFTIRRLTKRMGLHLLIQALGTDPLAHTYELRIAGSGAMESELKKLAAQFPKLTVHFLGNISMKELESELIHADAFVLPTIALEGFGIATLEALLSGVPVIATNVGATPELLQPINPAMIADGANIDALQKAVHHFTDLSQKERIALGKKCRSVSLKAYSADAMNKKIIKAIKRFS